MIFLISTFALDLQKEKKNKKKQQLSFACFLEGKLGGFELI